MRMLQFVRIPHEPFNTAVRDGTAGPTIQKILETVKPEAAYFTEQDGTRGGVLVIHVDNPSQIPFFAEPWFLSFNADCEFRIAMRPEDLKEAGLDRLGKAWG
jgi:hypothetical protein